MIFARIFTGTLLAIVATMCIFALVSSTIDAHRRAMRTVKYVQYGAMK
jgi:hypothetical protein